MQNFQYEAIKNSMLFHGIFDEDQKKLLECLNPKVEKFNKGAFVAHWGEKMQGLGVLLEGRLSIIKENIGGSRMIINILKPGELFGEMAIFTEKRVWPATIQAQTHSTVLFLSPDKIVGRCSNACHFHRQLTENMLKIVSEKALSLNRKVEYLSIKGMREKLCTYFWEEYKKSGKLLFNLSMNRNELAEFLNVSRPSMSREMCRMRDEGLIEFHLSTIKILNLELLATYVQ